MNTNELDRVDVDMLSDYGLWSVTRMDDGSARGDLVGGHNNIAILRGYIHAVNVTDSPITYLLIDHRSGYVIDYHTITTDTSITDAFVVTGQLEWSPTNRTHTGYAGVILPRWHQDILTAGTLAYLMGEPTNAITR